jgi:hypothetical protein
VAGDPRRQKVLVRPAVVRGRHLAPGQHGEYGALSLFLCAQNTHANALVSRTHAPLLIPLASSKLHPFPILILNAELSMSPLLRRRYAVEILHWRLPGGVRLQSPEKVDWLARLVGLYFRHRWRVSRRRDQVPFVRVRDKREMGIIMEKFSTSH